MLDKSIRYFRDVYIVAFILENTVDPVQTPHDVASDLGLHYLIVQSDWTPALFAVNREIAGTCTCFRASVLAFTQDFSSRF